MVYHASYLRFMERGRSEFLRLAGMRTMAMLEGEEPLVWASAASRSISNARAASTTRCWCAPGVAS